MFDVKTSKITERPDAAHTHTPGEILAGESEEIGLSARRLADVLEVPPNRLYQVLAGKRSMTADTALRLSNISDAG